MAAGYGRGGWSSGKYGQPTSIEVTGLAGTGAVGSVTITEGSGISTSVTGLAGTGAVGSVTVTQGAGVTVSVTGVAGTGAISSVAVSTDNSIAVTGLAGTGSVGSVVVQIPKTVNVTGVAGTSAVGSVTVTEGTGITVSATGVSGTGSVGSVTVATDSTTSVTGIAATGSVGSVTVATDSIVDVVGVSALGRINDVTVNFDFVVSVTGVSAEAVTSGVQVWGLITPSQSPSYSAITPSQSPSYSAITPSQNPSYTEIVPGSEVPTFTVTVDSKTGGGNAFYIDGLERPIIFLEEGKKYKFDTSESTNSGHFLRFSTTSDGTHAGGSIYTNGVTVVGTPGQSGSYTEIDLAEGAPTLHYFCTLHSGMGNSVDTKNQTTFAVTVASKTGGGNAFYIDGLERPLINLTEGSTYKFDLSDSTTSSHPFRLSSTSDGTHGGGSIYTDGVTIVGTQGQSGSYLQITVASDAPTLHYFCTVHSGMGNQINTNSVYTNSVYTNITPSQTPEWEEIAA
jgi:hypothetical protein